MDFAAELEDLFNRHFPQETQAALVKCLFSTYRVAFEQCKGFSPEGAHDLRPFLRWVWLREQLSGLSGRFGEIVASTRPNGAGSSYHVVLNAGCLTLTCSSAAGPGVLPRPASHRLAYANESQYDLFEKSSERAPQIYAILAHGVTREEQREPGFAHILFPHRDFSYAIHKIDLFKKFDDLVNELSVTPRTTETLPPPLSLRVNTEEEKKKIS
jgi:hypothetical protein